MVEGENDEKREMDPARELGERRLSAASERCRGTC